MEAVKNEDLKRFAVIDWMDLILFDSNELIECLNVYNAFKKSSKGIYDYLAGKYLDEVDIIDIIGVTFHSE